MTAFRAALFLAGVMWGLPVTIRAQERGELRGVGALSAGFGLGVHVGGRAGDLQRYAPSAMLRLEVAGLASPRVELRVAASITALPIPSGEDAVCFTHPQGGCRVHAAQPGRIGSLEVIGAFGSSRRSIRLLGGAGFAVLGDWRHGEAGQRPGARGTWLVGIEVPLGTTAIRMPRWRVQLTHTGFWGGGALPARLTMLTLVHR